jgi:dolichol-phosphate mannosyltransferase
MTSLPFVEGVSVSVLLWLIVPLAVTAMTAGTRHRLDARRPRPAPRELVRHALMVLPAHEDQRAQLRAIARVLDTDPRVDVLVVESSAGAPLGIEEVSPRVTVLRHAGVASDTAALQLGAARGLTDGYDAVVELPVRHSRLACRISALLDALDNGAHVAVGSRYVPGGRVIGCPYPRRVASRGVNAALRWMTGAPVSDVTARVRVYRREAVERALLPASGVDRALGVDVMLRCRDAGLTVTEVPVTVAGPLCAAVTPAGGRALLARAVRSRRRAVMAPAVIDLPEAAARV